MMFRSSQYVSVLTRPASGPAASRKSEAEKRRDKRRESVSRICKDRRERNKLLGLCINSPLHGEAHEAPVAPHVRCARCIEIHRKSQ